jgi:hypothetical protein
MLPSQFENHWRFAMKKLFFPLALAALLVPCAAAQNAFEGTWKIDFSKVDFPAKPDVYVLDNGMYTCKSCYTPYTVKADGTDQPVPGTPYADTTAVKVVNDHQIQQTFKKDGNVVNTTTTTVSPDGNTLTSEFSDSSATNGGPPVTGKGVSTRVAKGPAGSHLVSGSWRGAKLEGLSDNGAFFTYKISSDELTMTTPTGQSYTAKLDGTEAPYKGDPGTTSVQVRMVGKTLEETDKRDGKVLSISKMTVGPDGKTAKISVDDMRQKTTMSFSATKQ